jgi:hypothetical protein
MRHVYEPKSSDRRSRAPKETAIMYEVTRTGGIRRPDCTSTGNEQSHATVFIKTNHIFCPNYLVTWEQHPQVGYKEGWDFARQTALCRQ